MKNKSFTLIELLVVIAVIGLLASIVIVNLAGTRGKANIARGLQFSQSVHHALGSEAVGVWSFDEGSGTTAFDSSGYVNNGTLVNGPVWRCDDSPSGSGCSLQFDGVDDYVDLGANAPDMLGDVSVALWIIVLRENLVQTFISNGQTHTGAGFNLGISGANNRFLLRRGSDGVYAYSSNFVYTQGQWVYLVISSDSAGLTSFYINGALAGANQPSQTPQAGPNNLVIGALANEQYFMKAIIDDVRIYEKALETAQIEELYYAGLDSLLARGLMDEQEYQERLVRR